MRQFLTLRFWMTLLALVGLVLLGIAITRDSDPARLRAIGPTLDTSDHAIDLISAVATVQMPLGFDIVDGRTTADFALVLDAARTMVVKAGTRGNILCAQPELPGQCTVAADLLGDAVLWFSLVDGPPGATVRLPAVMQLRADGTLLLANGWVVHHAPKVDRLCSEETTSLTDFINRYGISATSTFSFESQEIVRVTCPRAATPTTTTTSTTIVPSTSAAPKGG